MQEYTNTAIISNQILMNHHHDEPMQLNNICRWSYSHPFTK